MSESATYSVILKGSIKPGFKPDQVVSAFARLCKVPPERASKILGKPFVLKRELEPRLARQYAAKLSQIGIEVMIRRDSANPLSEKYSMASDRAAQAKAGAAEARPITAKLLIAPAIVAVLGVILWYLIAVKLEFELALIAWIIGGGVGLAARVSGGRGRPVGAACVVLVLLSILAGKYMAASAFHADLEAFLESTSSAKTSDFKSIYEEEMKDARAFFRMPKDDDNIKHFMVARGYSEFIDASQVTSEEIDRFRADTAPRLKYLYDKNPSFTAWHKYTLGASTDDLSAIDLMVGSFGIIDLLFVLIAIGTAYHIGSGGSLNWKEWNPKQRISAGLGQLSSPKKAFNTILTKLGNKAGSLR